MAINVEDFVPHLLRSGGLSFQTKQRSVEQGNVALHTMGVAFFLHDLGHAGALKEGFDESTFVGAYLRRGTAFVQSAATIGGKGLLWRP